MHTLICNLTSALTLALTVIRARIRKHACSRKPTQEVTNAQTRAAASIERLSLLRLDGDLYASTRDALEVCATQTLQLQFGLPPLRTLAQFGSYHTAPHELVAVLVFGGGVARV